MEERGRKTNKVALCVQTQQQQVVVDYYFIRLLWKSSGLDRSAFPSPTSSDDFYVITNCLLYCYYHFSQKAHFMERKKSREECVATKQYGK
jgi:hypothetical protein